MASRRMRKKFVNFRERPSLKMTNLAVEYFSQNVSPRLGQVDMDFAAAVTRKTRVSPCTLMLAFVYVDRLRLHNPEYLRKVSSSDLFLVSMIVASKFLHDEGEKGEILNYKWADLAFMDLQDVNQLEREFLAAMNWNVFVSADTLKRIVDRTESVLALREGKAQGWFSYSDLEILSRWFRKNEIFILIMDQILKVTVVCAVTYAAGFFTLLASMYTVSRIMGPINITPTPNEIENSTLIPSQCFNTKSGLPFGFDYENFNVLPLCELSLTRFKNCKNGTRLNWMSNLTCSQTVTQWSFNKLSSVVTR